MYYCACNIAENTDLCTLCHKYYQSVSMDMVGAKCAQYAVGFFEKKDIWDSERPFIDKLTKSFKIKLEGERLGLKTGPAQA